MASYLDKLRASFETTTDLDGLLKSLATSDHTVQASMAAVPDSHFERYLEIVNEALRSELGIGPDFGPEPVTTLIQRLPASETRRAVFVKTFNQLMGLCGSPGTRKKWIPASLNNPLCVEVAGAWLDGAAPELILDDTGDVFGMVHLLLRDGSPASMLALDAFARRSVANGAVLRRLRYFVGRYGSAEQAVALGLTEPAPEPQQK